MSRYKRYDGISFFECNFNIKQKKERNTERCSENFLKETQSLSYRNYPNSLRLKRASCKQRKWLYGFQRGNDRILGDFSIETMKRKDNSKTSLSTKTIYQPRKIAFKTKSLSVECSDIHGTSILQPLSPRLRKLHRRGGKQQRKSKRSPDRTRHDAHELTPALVSCLRPSQD